MGIELHNIKTLQGKFFLYVLPPVVACFLLFSLLYSVVSYREKKEDIITNLQEHAEIQSALLAKTLWDINFGLTAMQMESILLIPNVSGVRVVEFTTDAVLEKGVLPVIDEGNNYLIHQTPITYQAPSGKQQVGYLTLVADISEIYTPLGQSLFRDLFLLLLLILVIVASAVWANKRIIGRPLELFLQAIRTEEKEETRKQIDWDVEDELGTVIRAYNKLLASVDAAQLAMQESEEKFRNVVERANDGIIILQKDNITYSNARAAEIVGYQVDEVLGVPFLSLVSRSEQPKVMGRYQRRHAGEDVISVYGTELRHKSGKIVFVEINTALLTVGGIASSLVIIRDISARKQEEQARRELETKLQQAHKMEAIGTLAGGIAHDFNNTLGAIIGYSEMARRQVEGESKLGQNLDKVLVASNRAKDLVGQILAFSRQAESEKIYILPHQVIKEVIQLLRSTIPTTISIQLDLDSSCGMIKADPTQFHQIVMNLCTNAYHAMEVGGGIMTISLKSKDVRLEDLFDEPTLVAGKYVELTVKDTGVGIDPEDQKRIFDPFFTTKEVGKGTGMGLATVHGLVKNHGGTISCTSEKGEGTSFQVLLPEKIKQVEVVTKSNEELPLGSEHILYVDDEPFLTDLGKQLFESLGYTVTAETSSRQALQLFREQPQRFDIVMSDQTMPDMTGTELARELLTIRPDIPIVLCTGYSSIVNREEALTLGIKEFVMKPMVMNEIAPLIRRLLDSHQQPTDTSL